LPGFLFTHFFNSRFDEFGHCQQRSARTEIAHIFHIAENQLRVVSPDVGGGFGLKGGPFPDDALVLWASKKLRRPVKWVATRSEAMMTDHTGRDLVSYGELALDEKGKILAIRSQSLFQVGAYFVGPGMVSGLFSMRFIPEAYDVQAIHVMCKGLFTNTPQAGPYRGAGRPEAAYFTERMIEHAAKQIGMDVAEIRRVNLISSDKFPYNTPTWYCYDSGDFVRLLDKCIDVQGDTAQVQFGRGTYGARSAVVGGSALRRAADAIIDKAKSMAATMLEADEGDIEFKDGNFTVAGTDKAIPLVEVAKASFAPMGPMTKFGVGLEGSGSHSPEPPSHPNGAHAVEVEIDPETGEVSVDRYVMVDDLGQLLNPMIVNGQQHGGVAQGIGQALYEHAVYDRSTAQLVTGSFMDYAMPRADMLPKFEIALEEVRCKTNPIGVKGIGESGTIGAPPVVINAIIDALRPLGIDRIDMPATPSRVWQAIQSAKGAA
jgi:CO/xanthine dehydrogenase Mo-binding subunit